MYVYNYDNIFSIPPLSGVAGTFHLIHMLVDDYIVHLLENKLEREQQRNYEQKIAQLRDSKEGNVVCEPLTCTCVRNENGANLMNCGISLKNACPICM